MRNIVCLQSNLVNLISDLSLFSVRTLNCFVLPTGSGEGSILKICSMYAISIIGYTQALEYFSDLFRNFTVVFIFDICTIQLVSVSIIRKYHQNIIFDLFFSICFNFFTFIWLTSRTGQFGTAIQVPRINSQGWRFLSIDDWWYSLYTSIPSFDEKDLHARSCSVFNEQLFLHGLSNYGSDVSQGKMRAVCAAELLPHTSFE